VLDGLTVIDGTPPNMMPHLSSALSIVGTGTDMVTLRFPIRAVTDNRTVSHALKLVMARNYAGGLPFTVNAAPLPAFTVAAPTGPLAPGTAIGVRADHPVALLPGTAGMPVTFRLSSPALGRWQPFIAASPAEALGSWDDRFTPFRAEATFVPSSRAEAGSGNITVIFAGRSVSVPISVAAVAPPPVAATPACDPAFAVAAVSGGLRVSMTNRGRGTCPTYSVRPRPIGKIAAPLTPAQIRLVSPALGTVGGKGLTATFKLDAAAIGSLKPGTRVEFDLVPDGAKATDAPQRTEITLKASDIAIIAKK
jgi:hypothetical protein